MLISKKAENLLKLLKKEIVPALGCTEPIAVALAVAKAREILEEIPDKIIIKTSLNIYKNGMGVGIPGTNMVGLDIASALGAIAGKSEKELEVLVDIKPKDVYRAEEYLNSGAIDITIKQNCDKLYIEVNCIKGENTSCAIIEGSHRNFILIKHNNDIILSKESNNSGTTKEENKDEELYKNTVDEIFEFATTHNIEDLKYILDLAAVNKTLSDYGIAHKSGMGVGANLLSWINRAKLSADFSNYAMAITAAASDARMSGALLPAMSNSGSGNQGITVMLPVLAVGEKIGSSKEDLIRALILSNLCAIHIKKDFGRLSAACGCVVASTGAACGVCYLLGGKLDNIKYAIKNMVGNLAGMLCDGAKLGCALKVASGTNAAIQSAMLAADGICVPSNNGIVEEDIEKTIRNLGVIANEAMGGADDVILEIMLNK